MEWHGARIIFHPSYLCIEPCTGALFHRHFTTGFLGPPWFLKDFCCRNFGLLPWKSMVEDVFPIEIVTFFKGHVRFQGCIHFYFAVERFFCFKGAFWKKPPTTSKNSKWPGLILQMEVTIHLWIPFEKVTNKTPKWVTGNNLEGVFCWKLVFHCDRHKSGKGNSHMRPNPRHPSGRCFCWRWREQILTNGAFRLEVGDIQRWEKMPQIPMTDPWGVGYLSYMNGWFSRWWFQIFFIFTRTWGRFPFWLIFLRWVVTTNQKLTLVRSTMIYYRPRHFKLLMLSTSPGSFQFSQEKASGQYKTRDRSVGFCYWEPY